MNEKTLEYRTRDGLNFSTLSALDYSPKYCKYREVVDSDAFRLGSAVDCLLFTKEEFKNEYAVSSIERPTEKLGLYTDFLLKHPNIENVEQLAYEYSGFKISLERVKESFHYKCKPYYDFIKTLDKKTLLTLEEYELATKMATSYLESSYTAKWFLLENSETMEIYTQFPIYWKYGEEECKSLLDLFIVDHINKVLIPIDGKTTGSSLLDFPKSFLKYKYYLQAAFYTEGVKYYKEFIRPELKNYTIDNFRFLVSETKMNNLPICYKTSVHDLYCGKHGGQIQGKEFVRGFKALIEEYKWHRDTGMWDYPRNVYESDGELEIAVFSN